MNAQAYKTAIGIISSGDVDYKNIAIKLAQENPELFCKYIGAGLPESDPYAFAHNTFYDTFNGDKEFYIQTIKAVREKFGLGLKEAKDLVDEVRYNRRW